VSKAVVDTCGWLAYFADEPNAGKFAPYIEEEVRVLVPGVVEYEVYRWAVRTVGEELADQYAAAVGRHESVALDAQLARRAAELGHAHKLAACDALIYASAESRGAAVVTADPDLQGLPGVEFHRHPRTGGATRKARRGAAREREGDR
jgi:predicted nucleic acid-binding protein